MYSFYSQLGSLKGGHQVATTISSCHNADLLQNDGSVIASQFRCSHQVEGNKNNITQMYSTSISPALLQIAKNLMDGERTPFQ